MLQAASQGEKRFRRVYPPVRLSAWKKFCCSWPNFREVLQLRILRKICRHRHFRKVKRISRQPSPVTITIDQKQLENVKCFKYLGSMLTDDGRCICEIKSRIAMAKAKFNKKKNLFTSKCELNLRKKLVKCYVWSMAVYGAETWTLRATDQKRLESFEICCWRRMEISWTDHVRNEEMLLRVNEQRNILHEIRKRKAKWIGHILRRNCLLKQVIEGKI